LDCISDNIISIINYLCLYLSSAKNVVSNVGAYNVFCMCTIRDYVNSFQDFGSIDMWMLFLGL